MMLATALRKSILQAAIAGQLTEQRADDGDARDLLAGIRKEKARLVRAGKLKKERALPEIREDEVPFEVPENWCWARLGDVLDVRDGTHDTPPYVEKGIPLVTSKNLSNGSVHFDKVKYIGRTDAEKINQRSFVDNNDILFAMIGSIGNPALVHKTTEFCIKNVALFKNVNSLIHMRYAYCYLLIAQTDIKSKSSGGVQSFVSLSFLKKYPFPLPPRKEQIRITKKLDTIMKELDALEHDEDELTQIQASFPARMKSSLLLAAMRGELTEREPGDGDARDLLKTIEREKKRLIKEKRLKREKPLPPVAEEDVPFEIPSNWCWVRLTELGAFSSGKTPNKLDQRNWNNGTYSWITSKDMKKKYLSDSMIHITEFAKNNLREYPAGTMLLVVRSGILKRLLPIAILEKPSTINQDIKAYELFLPKMLDFVYYAIKAFEPMILHDYRKQVTTVDSLKFDEFSKGMPLPLPPLAEQRRIVARLEELLGAVENG